MGFVTFFELFFVAFFSSMCKKKIVPKLNPRLLLNLILCARLTQLLRPGDHFIAIFANQVPLGTSYTGALKISAYFGPTDKDFVNL